MEVIDRLQTKDFIELENTYGAHNYHPLDVVIEHAEGVWVYDVEGNRYLDCLASYSAVNQGHCHPKILKAMIEQARRVTLTSRAFRNDQLPMLYQELHDLTGFDMTLPMNSGAEAVETAVKAARKWGYKLKGIPDGKAEIIVCANNFHGRTVTIVSFSTDEQYRDGFGPFTPGFKVIPFGDTKALRQAITPSTCAFQVRARCRPRARAPWPSRATSTSASRSRSTTGRLRTTLTSQPGTATRAPTPTPSTSIRVATRSSSGAPTARTPTCRLLARRRFPRSPTVRPSGCA